MEFDNLFGDSGANPDKKRDEELDERLSSEAEKARLQIAGALAKARSLGPEGSVEYLGAKLCYYGEAFSFLMASIAVLYDRKGEYIGEGFRALEQQTRAVHKKMESDVRPLKARRDNA